MTLLRRALDEYIAAWMERDRFARRVDRLDGNDADTCLPGRFNARIQARHFESDCRRKLDWCLSCFQLCTGVQPLRSARGNNPGWKIEVKDYRSEYRSWDVRLRREMILDVAEIVEEVGLNVRYALACRGDEEDFSRR